MRWIPVFALLALGCGGGDEACDDWFCEEGKTTGDDDDDGKTTTGKGGTGKGDDDDKEGDYATLSGSIDITTGMGWLYLDGTDCASEMIVNQSSEDTSCADCDFAFQLTATDLEPGNTDCDDTAYYLNAPLGVGHSDADGLFIDKDGFTPSGGTSSVSGDIWDFDFAGK